MRQISEYNATFLRYNKREIFSPDPCELKSLPSDCIWDPMVSVMCIKQGKACLVMWLTSSLERSPPSSLVILDASFPVSPIISSLFFFDEKKREKLVWFDGCLLPLRGSSPLSKALKIPQSLPLPGRQIWWLFPSDFFLNHRKIFN